MDTIKNKIIIGMFLSFIFGISLTNLLTKDREVSETENRPLQQLPIFSFERLLSGRYTEQFDQYMMDQFIMKDNWVGLKSDVERVLFQKKENNGIYFAEDDYLLEVFTEAGPYYERNLEAINAFHDKLPDISSTVILVPTAVKIYEDKLPLFAPIYDQAEMLEVAQNSLTSHFINAYNVLNKHKDEYIYYKTDHHWTTLGAYYIYQQLMKEWGMVPYLDYKTEIVSTEFYGTYYSKANNYHLKPDEIEVYYPQDETTFSVTWDYQADILKGLYNYNYLNQKDKYSMFLNGNHPLTIVKSSVKNGKKLIVFKDSYAHNFVPFLAMNFEEIHMIDLRYFNLNPYDYIRQQGFEQALFLYNLSTFGSDSTIHKLKVLK